MLIIIQIVFSKAFRDPYRASEMVSSPDASLIRERRESWRP